MKTERLYLRISPKRIYYLKFILEGYDGMATLSTIDPGKGIVILRYSREWSRDLFELLASLAPELRATG
ncbi:MAG: DUF4911 domain-containing protein [Thermodesulfobacteriota bacterium]